MLHAFFTAVQDISGITDPDLAVKAVSQYWGLLGAGLGVGLTVIGTGLGIGRIGESVASGIARQPEGSSGSIQTAGIILAALIEGVALFGLVIGLLFKLM